MTMLVNVISSQLATKQQVHPKTQPKVSPPVRVANTRLDHKKHAQTAQKATSAYPKPKFPLSALLVLGQR